MSNGGPLPFDEIFPNEVIRMFFEPLSDRQKIGVQRVSRVWRFLNSDLLSDLKNFVNTEYPFLVEGKQLADSGYVSAFEKQPKIYAELASDYALSPTFLQNKQLKSIYFDKVRYRNLKPLQQKFIAELAVASDTVENDIRANPTNVLILMAYIGNLPKLKRWLEPTPEIAGKLPAISATNKGAALRWAVEKGHLECVCYLIDTCGQDTPADDKRWALQAATEKGQIECMRYLIDTCGQDISYENKRFALQAAAKNGHVECVQLLEQHLNLASSVSIASPLIYTPAATEDKKRKRENDNINEEDNSSEKKATFHRY